MAYKKKRILKTIKYFLKLQAEHDFLTKSQPKWDKLITMFADFYEFGEDPESEIRELYADAAIKSAKPITKVKQNLYDLYRLGALERSVIELKEEQKCLYSDYKEQHTILKGLLAKEASTREDVKGECVIDKIKPAEAVWLETPSLAGKTQQPYDSFIGLRKQSMLLCRNWEHESGFTEILEKKFAKAWASLTNEYVTKPCLRSSMWHYLCDLNNNPELFTMSTKYYKEEGVKGFFMGEFLFAFARIKDAPSGKDKQDLCTKILLECERRLKAMTDRTVINVMIKHILLKKYCNFISLNSKVISSNSLQRCADQESYRVSNNIKSINI